MNPLDRFTKDTEKHTLTIIKEDGVYRHIRCARPDTGNMSFNIITWPGYLAYCGDMGDFVFARTTDMFEFFRGHQINPQYWSEKVQAACRDGVEEYSEKEARAVIADCIGDANITADQKEYIDDLDYETEHDLRRGLSNYPGRLFNDAWEMNFQDYTGRFIWCCHALVWAIAEYDKTKAAP